MAATFEDKSRALLEAPNFCHVATLRKDGTPHVVPVWVDLEGDEVLLNTAEGRAWPTNARRDPRVTLTVQNLENPYEYVSIRGHVAEDTHDGADDHIDRLAKKYLDKNSYPFRQEGEQRVTFKVTPDEVRHWGA